MKKTSVLIIGCGASGMIAGIMAARSGAAVTILERQNKAGRKLLSTGNGRCNFTNLNQEMEHYHSNNPGFYESVLKQFSAQDTIQFMKGIGVLSKNRSFFGEDGYMYPYSDQAKSVVDNLRSELEHLGVKIHYQVELKQPPYFRKKKNQFLVICNTGEYVSDRLILANGSIAAAKLGADDSGYMYAKSFGHRITPLKPSLVGICCEEQFLKEIAGIRITANLSLYQIDDSNNRDVIAESSGEIQLTNYGVSGIPTFQLSRYVEKSNQCLQIDFMPDYPTELLQTMLMMRKEQLYFKKTESFLIGLLPDLLATLLIRMNKLSGKTVQDLTYQQIFTLVNSIKNFTFVVKGTNSYDQAQVCSGGVDTREINPNTLESTLQSGLYIVGELLDVDGDCGGYNLQWAWASGAVAGMNVSRCVWL